MAKLPNVSRYQKGQALLTTNNRGQALLTTNNRGQALLIVLLAMSVVLTVVLSNVSRSITEISISEVEEDSQRAFSAAEAGVEEVLLKQQASSGTFANAEFVATYDDAIPSEEDEFVYPKLLSAGETATFWLVGHDSNGNLDCSSGDCTRANQIEVCYGNSGTPATGLATDPIPAIVVSVVHDYDYAGSVFGNGIAASPQDYSKFISAKRTIDTNRATRGNNFDSSGFTNCDSGGDSKIAGQGFAFSTGTIQLGNPGLEISAPNCRNFEGCLIMVKVKMHYNASEAHKLGLRVNTQGGTSLPPQGKLVESTGTSGEATRKVNVFRGFSEPADIFNNALFVENIIDHN